jgi:hypothetical protein
MEGRVSHPFVLKEELFVLLTREEWLRRWAEQWSNSLP